MNEEVEIRKRSKFEALFPLFHRYEKKKHLLSSFYGEFDESNETMSEEEKNRPHNNLTISYSKAFLLPSAFVNLKIWMVAVVKLVSLSLFEPKKFFHAKQLQINIDLLSTLSK